MENITYKDEDYLEWYFTPTHEWLVGNWFILYAREWYTYKEWDCRVYNNWALYYHTVDNRFKIYTDSWEWFITLYFYNAVRALNFCFHCLDNFK